MSRLNIRFIVKMLGMMLILETFFMLIATAVAFFYKGSDFYPFLISSGMMCSAGIVLYLLGRRADEQWAGRREGMLTVTLTWMLFAFFGMFPFYFGGYVTNITDAYFEAMAGFTTTGASILVDVEVLPHGILFWRSLTQWQGGMGMIVFTVAVMPIFGGGAAQLFDAETPGITHERFRPRVTQVAKRLFGIYVILTLVLVLLLWGGPMELFDAVNHALTTISTGGYSTKNASVAYWNSAYVEYILMIFMIIGSVNFTLIYFLFKGKFGKIARDEESRWFFILIIVTVAIVMGWLLYNQFETDIETAFRKSAFQIISLVSTSGYYTDDFIPWGPFFWMIALIVMVICGCAGSTSGGLKMGRVVILVKNLLSEFKKQTHPNAIIPVRMNGRVIPSETVQRVLAFAFAYIVLVVISAMVLMVDGFGFDESIGAAVSAISNAGPGLGTLGPVGNYSTLSVEAKWFLSFLMMVGRLEIFTVLTILLPGFWKQ